MKKKMLILTVVIAAAVAFQGTSSPPEILPGKYDVCGDHSQVQLSINNDHTFFYYDVTRPSEKLNIKGNWEQRGSVIVLKDYTSPRKIHSVWRPDKKFPCLKSRLGMEFRRLCLEK